jgi:hypothetical protein
LSPPHHHCKITRIMLIHLPNLEIYLTTLAFLPSLSSFSLLPLRRQSRQMSHLKLCTKCRETNSREDSKILLFIYSSVEKIPRNAKHKEWISHDQDRDRLRVRIFEKTNEKWKTFSTENAIKFIRKLHRVFRMSSNFARHESYEWEKKKPTKQNNRQWKFHRTHKSRPGQRVENIESRKFMKQEKMFFVFFSNFNFMFLLSVAWLVTPLAIVNRIRILNISILIPFETTLKTFFLLLSTKWKGHKIYSN